MNGVGGENRLRRRTPEANQPGGRRGALLLLLATAAAAFPERRFVCPVHPNPRVRRPLVAALETLPNIELRAPFAYPQMLDALGRARAVLTDSGGLQEESAWLGTPCLVLRRRTDRPESVAANLAWETHLDARRTTDVLTDIFASSRSRTVLITSSTSSSCCTWPCHR